MIIHILHLPTGLSSTVNTPKHSLSSQPWKASHTLTRMCNIRTLLSGKLSWLNRGLSIEKMERTRLTFKKYSQMAVLRTFVGSHLVLSYSASNRLLVSIWSHSMWITIAMCDRLLTCSFVHYSYAVNLSSAYTCSIEDRNHFILTSDTPLPNIRAQRRRFTHYRCLQRHRILHGQSHRYLHYRPHWPSETDAIWRIWSMRHYDLVGDLRQHR